MLCYFVGSHIWQFSVNQKLPFLYLSLLFFLWNRSWKAFFCYPYHLYVDGFWTFGTDLPTKVHVNTLCVWSPGLSQEWEGGVPQNLRVGVRDTIQFKGMFEPLSQKEISEIKAVCAILGRWKSQKIKASEYCRTRVFQMVKKHWFRVSNFLND